MTITTLDEPVAIVAKRSEWAALLVELSESTTYGPMLDENIETMSAAIENSSDATHLIDTIAIINVDTQLRIEQHVPATSWKVKIMKSKSLTGANQCVSES